MEWSTTIDGSGRLVIPKDIRIRLRLTAGTRLEITEDEGKVIHVSRVADPASETLEVRVELPNPSTRLAGEHVTVTFPEPGNGKSKSRSTKSE